MATVIGLSFGNTSSSIAYEKDGKAEVIANQDGERSIPSVLSYAGVDEFHGQQAKNQLVRNAKNTVANFRDFIGLDFSKVDATNCHASAHPVEKDGKTTFHLTKATSEPDEEGNFETETNDVSVNEIVERHLDRLRDSAQDYIGKPIDGAVIAVPTNFSEDQRKELEKIASAAKIEILQIIHEPTAALLTHVSTRSITTDRLFLVLDFGGTRADGAIIAYRGGMFTILATAHDYELGGDKLDECLMDYFANEFEKKHSVDPRKEARGLAKLKAESEAVKRTLSNTSTANFAVESLASGIDYHCSINRLRFELTGRPVFSRFALFAEELVKKAGLDLLDIEEVVMAGGTSYVPKVAASVQALFPESTHVVAPSTDVKALHPTELVARGCAIQASLISGYDKEEIDESLQAVVTSAPHTSQVIGVLGSDGLLVPIVDIDTPIPIKKSHTFTTPGSGNVLIGLYEGKSELKITKVEKPAKEEAEQDEDESDWSEDEEDEEIKEKIVKPVTKIAEIVLSGVSEGSDVEVIVSIACDFKMQFSAREVKNGGVAARGVIPAK